MLTISIATDPTARELRTLAKDAREGRGRARLLAVAACWSGRRRGEAAELTGWSRNVLRIWIGRYNAQGVEGLRDRPRSCRPRITAERRRRLRERVRAGPDPERNGVVAFRIVDIQRLGRAEFDIGASVDDPPAFAQRGPVLALPPGHAIPRPTKQFLRPLNLDSPIGYAMA